MDFDKAPAPNDLGAPAPAAAGAGAGAPVEGIRSDVKQTPLVPSSVASVNQSTFGGNGIIKADIESKRAAIRSAYQSKDFKKLDDEINKLNPLELLTLLGERPIVEPPPHEASKDFDFRIYLLDRFKDYLLEKFGIQFFSDLFLMASHQANFAVVEWVGKHHIDVVNNEILDKSAALLKQSYEKMKEDLKAKRPHDSNLKNALSVYAKFLKVKFETLKIDIAKFPSVFSSDQINIMQMRLKFRAALKLQVIQLKFALKDEVNKLKTDRQLLIRFLTEYPGSELLKENFKGCQTGDDFNNELWGILLGIIPKTIMEGDSQFFEALFFAAVKAMNVSILGWLLGAKKITDLAVLEESISFLSKASNKASWINQKLVGCDPFIITSLHQTYESMIAFLREKLSALQVEQYQETLKAETVKRVEAVKTQTVNVIQPAIESLQEKVVEFQNHNDAEAIKSARLSAQRALNDLAATINAVEQSKNQANVLIRQQPLLNSSDIYFLKINDWAVEQKNKIGDAITAAKQALAAVRPAEQSTDLLIAEQEKLESQLQRAQEIQARLDREAERRGKLAKLQTEIPVDIIQLRNIKAELERRRPAPPPNVAAAAGAGAGAVYSRSVAGEKKAVIAGSKMDSGARGPFQDLFRAPQPTRRVIVVDAHQIFQRFVNLYPRRRDRPQQLRLAEQCVDVTQVLEANHLDATDDSLQDFRCVITQKIIPGEACKLKKSNGKFQYYNKADLVTWIKQKGTDPLNPQRKLTQNDILPAPEYRINLFRNLKEIAETAETNKSAVKANLEKMIEELGWPSNIIDELYAVGMAKDAKVAPPVFRSSVQSGVGGAAAAGAAAPVPFDETFFEEIILKMIGDWPQFNKGMFLIFDPKIEISFFKECMARFSKHYRVRELPRAETMNKLGLFLHSEKAEIAPAEKFLLLDIKNKNEIVTKQVETLQSALAAVGAGAGAVECVPKPTPTYKL